MFLPHFLFASSFYISKSGSNSNGQSWSSAWNEMNQINWTNILPGDTIYVDGGSTEMVYTTPLTIGKSGVSGSPICILLSKEADRHGKATIFGGAILPYDNQPTYTGSMPAFDSGIMIGAYSWITIDGTKWEGITIHGTGHDGIVLGEHSRDTTKEAHDIVLRNIKIYDIGTPQQVDSTVLKQNSEYATLTFGYWHSKANATGIFFSYQVGASNVTMERLIISNISDEAIGEGPCRNLVLRQCWLDNGRNRPDGKPFNYLNHPDGYQNYGWGGDQGPWLIEDCVIGPRFMQGLFPGCPTSDPNATDTYVNNITVRNVLFLDNLSSNILGQMGHDWTFDHITSYVSSPTVGNNINMQAGVSIDTFTNSIIYGGNIYYVNPAVFLNNVYYNTVGANIHSINASNVIADPLFVNRSGYDLALQAGSPATGKGSRVTSVAQLFALFPDLKPGFFQMSRDNYTAPDTVGKVTITVQRMSAMDGVVTVTYATADSTATAEINYTSTTGTLLWADGDHADKSFDIPIIHSSASMSKVVKIVLSNPTGGTTIEPPQSAILIITPVTPTGVGNSTQSIPDRFSLLQNYPNPFNPSSSISFSLPTRSFVSLKVFDLTGREVATIVSEEMSSGSYTKQWDAVGIPSGVYFYRLQTSTFTETKKLVLLK
jgi:hypothetical protein